MAISTRSKNNNNSKSKGKGRANSPRVSATATRRVSAPRVSSSKPAASERTDVDDDGRPYHEQSLADTTRTLIDNGTTIETVIRTKRTYLDDDDSMFADSFLLKLYANVRIPALPKIIHKKRITTDTETTEILFADAAAALECQQEAKDSMAMDVCEPYNSDMDPPESLLFKEEITKFRRFLTVSQFFEDTKAEIGARVKAQMAIYDAEEKLAAACQGTSAAGPSRTPKAALAAPSATATPGVGAALAIDTAPVANTPPTIGTAPAVGVAPAVSGTPVVRMAPAVHTTSAANAANAPRHAPCQFLVAPVASTNVPGAQERTLVSTAPAPRQQAVTANAPGAQGRAPASTFTANQSSSARAPNPPQAQEARPVHGPSILLPSYPSASNGFRGGPVVRTCNRPFKGNVYIEISSDDDEGNEEDN